MKYASKDLYDYANQMPTLKKCIKKSVLEYLNLSGVSPEREKLWYAADITRGDIDIFKRSDMYIRNKVRFERYAIRFASAVNNIELGTRRNETEKHRGTETHSLVEAAQILFAEINERTEEAVVESGLRQPNLRLNYAEAMSL